jgi:hypothetical protein
MLLVLKLFLVPALIALVSVAVRRWGPRVGGILASLPVVAGPVLFFLAIEQGTAFAAEAARFTLVALVAVAGSGLAYGWVAQRAPWWVTLPASWACFIALALGLHWARVRALPGLVIALASISASRALLPPIDTSRPPAATAIWDVPFRMVSAMLLILVVTGIAGWLGPSLTGAFTPFPITLSVLLAFTHAREGAATMVRFLHGFMAGMWSFAVFCFALAMVLHPLGAVAGFALALAAQCAVQAGLLAWMRRDRPAFPLVSAGEGRKQ